MKFREYLTEKSMNMTFLIDQLINSMEHYDEDEFMNHLNKELGIDKKILKKMFADYHKMAPMKKFKNMPDDWEKWIRKYKTGVK